MKSRLNAVYYCNTNKVLINIYINDDGIFLKYTEDWVFQLDITTAQTESLIDNLVYIGEL
jgi:hypothetical protein